MELAGVSWDEIEVEEEVGRKGPIDDAVGKDP